MTDRVPKNGQCGGGQAENQCSTVVCVKRSANYCRNMHGNGKASQGTVPRGVTILDKLASAHRRLRRMLPLAEAEGSKKSFVSAPLNGMNRPIRRRQHTESPIVSHVGSGYSEDCSARCALPRSSQTELPGFLNFSVRPASTELQPPTFFSSAVKHGWNLFRTAARRTSAFAGARTVKLFKHGLQY